MSNKIQNVTGMPDILPKERRVFSYVEQICFKIASHHGYDKIETPLLEYSDLFEKGTGAASDIVQKQMYSFTTEGGDKLTLRPEFTPSIVRAYMQHGMVSWPQPVKLSSFGAVFRHERPQAGRYREFRQFELDALGDQDPILDAQIIFVFSKVFQALGIKHITVHINSIGCSKCRPNYRKVLREYYQGRERSLCKDCRERKKINLLRVLDCKDEKCERLKINAPEIVDHICQECKSHLRSVLEIADYLELPYVLSPHLVRGLDYYTKTVFEIFPAELGKQKTSYAEKEGGDKNKEIGGDKGEEGRMSAIAAGGRFDDLAKSLGEENVLPAVGGAIGIERTILYMHELGAKIPEQKPSKLFIAHVGDLAKKRCIKLIEELRLSGIHAKEALGKNSIKAQMSLANKLTVDYVLILGQQEVAEDTIIIRDMRSGSQEVVPIYKLIKEIKKRLKK